MIGLEKGKVILVEYDKSWGVEFENEKNSIQRAITDYKIGVEHVGSTSIDSLCAKPIIDILIGIEHFDDGFECIHDLEAIRYESKGENGVQGRHFFAKGNPRTHHIHMVEINSSFWNEHLLFRDYLRNNSDTRIRYSELKKELALKYVNDREKYTSSKSEFIQRIIKKAKEVDI
ncbi:MAG: GrpB family protein [Candidatus Delongbacteria bacterium]|nr:GrpB family protein [Candidatus Delongbacteria bacterium]